MQQAEAGTPVAEVCCKGAKPEDHVLLYRGRPVNSIRSAFATVIAHAEGELKRQAREARKEDEEVEAISLADVCLYTLRHTAATWMAQRGVPLWQIAGFLGHKDERMVNKHYLHHHPDHMSESKAASEAARVW